MSLKIKISSKSVLSGLQGVITGVQERKVSTQYNNEADVKEYPHLLRATVIKDASDVNVGQSLSIKLKDVGTFKVGQVIDFDKIELKNGKANLWADRRGFVQVSLKGDSLDAR